jgi:hypothetical protein
MNWLSTHFRRVVLAGAGGLLIVLGLFGSVLVVNGLILGGLLFGALLLLFVKLPTAVQRLARAHPDLTDGHLSTRTFCIIGVDTVTGLVAGGICALVISFAILLASELHAFGVLAA